MLIQLYNKDIVLNKPSLIIVLNKIDIETILLLSIKNKVLLVNNNDKYNFPNVYSLNYKNNYICFNGIVFLYSDILNDKFIVDLEKWQQYKCVVITNQDYPDILKYNPNLYINNNFVYKDSQIITETDINLK